jgi:protein SCO1/2
MWRAFAAVFMFVLALALTACSPPAPEPEAFRNSDITGADFGRSLTGLADQSGTPRTLADFHGKALVVFFGYTACPDVCPTTLARFDSALKELGAEAGRVQVVLITLDPERDNREKLGAYVSAFNPSFIGLSGDLPATEAVAREFKVFFAKSKGSDAAGGHAHAHGTAADGYMIDHSTGAYVFDPAGRLRLFIKDDAPVEAVVSDLRRLLTAG